MSDFDIWKVDDMPEKTADNEINKLQQRIEELEAEKKEWWAKSTFNCTSHIERIKELEADFEFVSKSEYEKVVEFNKIIKIRDRLKEAIEQTINNIETGWYGDMDDAETLVKDLQQALKVEDKQ